MSGYPGAKFDVDKLGKKSKAHVMKAQSGTLYQTYRHTEIKFRNCRLFTTLSSSDFHAVPSPDPMWVFRNMDSSKAGPLPRTKHRHPETRL